jgi:hypothetical protein
MECLSANAVKANELPDAERLDEIAAILAAGLVRLRHRQAGENRFSAGNCLEVPAETRLSVTVDARKGDTAWN